MKSLYLLRYRRCVGGPMQMQPVYAKSAVEGWNRFLNRLLAWQGCDVDGYQFTGHREIPEHEVKLSISAHRDHIARLTDDEQRCFYQDRQARNESKGESISNRTARNLKRLSA